MQEKIKKINEINSEIEKAQEFLYLVKRGGEFSEKYKKQNNFCSLNLASYIYTGSDNPRYDKSLQNPILIKKIADNIKSILEDFIIENETKLSELIKN